MKLDRNIKANEGRGKYALVLLRDIAAEDDGKPFGGIPKDLEQALRTLEQYKVIDYGFTGTDREFFLIRLKDKYAAAALHAYASAAQADGEEEYSREITDMADRAGPNSPWCKKPD
jgi:glutamine synthetase